MRLALFVVMLTCAPCAFAGTFFADPVPQWRLFTEPVVTPFPGQECVGGQRADFDTAPADPALGLGLTHQFDRSILVTTWRQGAAFEPELGALERVVFTFTANATNGVHVELLLRQGDRLYSKPSKTTARGGAGMTSVSAGELEALGFDLSRAGRSIQFGFSTANGGRPCDGTQEIVSLHLRDLEWKFLTDAETTGAPRPLPEARAGQTVIDHRSLGIGFGIGVLLSVTAALLLGRARR